MQAREGLSIVFRILGWGPKLQRCLPLGTKAPGKGICQPLGKRLTVASNVSPVGGSPPAPRLPTHIAMSHTHHHTLCWALNRTRTGQGPLLWQSCELMMRCFLPFGSCKVWWFTAHLRFRSGSSFAGRA